MAQEIILTAEGYEELKNELQQLKTVKRAELADKIKTARGFGDLSENSEYDEAKNEQAIVEARILTLEEQDHPGQGCGEHRLGGKAAGLRV